MLKTESGTAELGAARSIPRVLSANSIDITQALKFLGDIRDGRPVSAQDLCNSLVAVNTHLDRGKCLEPVQKNRVVHSLTRISELLNKEDSPIFPAGSELAKGWRKFAANLRSRLEAPDRESVATAPQSPSCLGELRAPTEDRRKGSAGSSTLQSGVFGVGCGQAIVDVERGWLTLQVVREPGPVSTMLSMFGLSSQRGSEETISVRLHPARGDLMKVAIGSTNLRQDDRMRAVFLGGAWLVHGFLGGGHVIDAIEISANGVRRLDFACEDIKLRPYEEVMALVNPPLELYDYPAFRPQPRRRPHIPGS